MPTFDTAGPVTAAIKIGFGDVRIAASDRNDTAVEVRPTNGSSKADVKAAEDTRVEYADGELRVTGSEKRQIFGKGGSVDVVVELPAGSRVTGSLGMGPLRCEGRLGECRLATESGEIQVGEVEGAAELRSSHGDIAVAKAHAALTAMTSYGNVRVGEVSRDSVDLETAYGEIEVGVLTGVAAKLDVSTRHGALRNELAEVDAPDRSEQVVHLRAQTQAGDIVLRRA